MASPLGPQAGDPRLLQLGNSDFPCCTGRHRGSALPLPLPVAGSDALFVLSTQAACCPRAATRPSTLSCPSGTIPLGSAVHDILQPHPVVRYDLISVIHSPSGEFVWMIADLLVRYSSRAEAGLLSSPATQRVDNESPTLSGRSATLITQENPSFSARRFAISGSTFSGFRLGGVRASS